MGGGRPGPGGVPGAPGPAGCRNDTLNRAAFALGQLVGGGHLAAGEVVGRLGEAGLAVGLEAREVRATVRSGLRTGAGSPRHPLRRSWGR